MDNAPGGAVLERWPLVGRRADVEAALQAITDPRSAGVVVTGGPGVGKTRLADTTLVEAEAKGLRVVRAMGSETARAIPLGALAHLLPPEVVLAEAGEGSLDPVRLMAHARQALRDAAGRAVLSIDDAQHLDAVSATLLAQLVAEDAVALVITARTGARLPDTIAGLQRAGRIATIDLLPLTDPSVDTLLHLALGAPVEGRTSASLRVASSGNPLVLRELVRTAVAEGTLTTRDGVWYLDGPPPRPSGAAELLSDRLQHLDGDALAVVEALALAGPSRLDVMMTVADLSVLEGLEADDLIELRPGTAPGDPDLLALAHPLLVEAVRQQISPLRTRSVLAAHADRVEAAFGATGDDALRIATWRLDAGIEVDPSLLEAAAVQARLATDFALTARLAGAAERGRPTLRTGLLLGEALHQLAQWNESEAVLADAADRAGGLADRTALVMARSANLLFGLLQTDVATDIVQAAIDALPPGAHDEPDDVALARFELCSRIAMLQVYDGRPADALTTLGPRPDPLPDDSTEQTVAERRTHLRSRVVWAMTGGPALVLLGRTADAIEVTQTAHAEHVELGQDVGFPGAGSHMIALGHALQDHGELELAAQVAGSGYEATVLSGGLIGQLWFALHLGRIAMLRGHAGSVERWFRESLSLCATAGWAGPRAIATSGVAAGAALKGDADDAAQAIRDYESMPDQFRFLQPERCLGPAWTASAAGRLDDARALLHAGAEYAARTAQHSSEAWLLYEIARLGHGVEVVDRLTELEVATQSPLVSARANHVRAEAARDLDALTAAAERLAELGIDLGAAEAFAAAADLARAAGDQRRANSLSVRSTELIDRCEGTRSGRIISTEVVVPLSAREREVANLAAAGVPSKDIADKLFVSVRTVNNHLQNAYTKLGVSSRAELRAALDRGAAS
jgi:DNA-binding CsgD family transcriptional regulator